jgi:putative transposase
MARKERIHIPGAIYHVMLRGNDRRDIFGDDKDRFRFYGILNLVSQRYPFKIHAFCLMTNHIHMEIQVADIPLAKTIQSIAQRYTQWFNWRYHKVGHLFQGRYKAVMIDADEYLLELAAYLHLNPVRAHLVERPEKYRWSSHRAFLGKENLPWLETDFILSQFSSTLKQARSLFSDFVNRRIEQGRMKEFHGEKNPDSRIFGDEFFVSDVLHETEHDLLPKPGLDAVIAAIEKVYGKPAEELLKTHSSNRLSCEARSLAAWATNELSGATLTDLAQFCRRDVATLCHAARRAETLSEIDQAVYAKKRLLEEELTTIPPPTASQQRKDNSQEN